MSDGAASADCAADRCIQNQTLLRCSALLKCLSSRYFQHASQNHHLPFSFAHGGTLSGSGVQYPYNDMALGTRMGYGDCWKTYVMEAVTALL